MAGVLALNIVMASWLCKLNLFPRRLYYSDRLHGITERRLRHSKASEHRSSIRKLLSAQPRHQTM